MKPSTILKYTDMLNAAKASGLSLSAFCNKRNINYKALVSLFVNLRKEQSENTQELLDLYNEVTHKQLEEIDTDDAAETSVTRGEDGKIISYDYKIFRRNREPLIGSLSREEMNLIHRLYSYYGDSLTQRVISRHFVELSLIDFKRILRAFNITKASGPFASFMYEEYTEEELRDIQLREKENSFYEKQKKTKFVIMKNY